MFIIQSPTNKKYPLTNILQEKIKFTNPNQLIRNFQNKMFDEVGANGFVRKTFGIDIIWMFISHIQSFDKFSHIFQFHGISPKKVILDYLLL